MNSRMISVWTNVSRTANTRLVNGVINVLVAYPDNYFDILESIRTLQQHRKFPPEYCDQLLQKFSHLDLPNRQTLSIFVLDIAKHVTPVKFFELLYLIGLPDLAEEVCCEYNGPVHRKIHRARIPHSKHLQEHFYKIKSHLDDTDPAERRQYLRRNTNYLKLAFETSENIKALTKSANKFAVNTWLCVQQCNRNTCEIREILTDMRAKSWPNAVDPILSEIVFESKMAVVSAMEGAFTFAVVHQRNAKLLAREYHDPLTKALVSHDSRYVSQILARNKVADRRSVLAECEIGLRFLESESNGNEFCVHMERSFLLYIAEFYLRIENDFLIKRSIPIPARDLGNAAKVLYVVKHLQSRLLFERRRKMVYKVCMARLHEVQRNYHMAIAYLCQAEHLSEGGAFFQGDITNIADFKSRLQRLQDDEN